MFVDANGAYSRKQALAFARRLYDEFGVVWFEEPVSSDDLDGLHLLRDRGPAGMDIAAGEYGYDLPYFRRMLDAGAVDVLAGRCHALRRHHGLLAGRRSVQCPLPGAVGPLRSVAASVHVCAAIMPLRPMEYFPRSRSHRTHAVRRRSDVRRRACCSPDLSRPGMGLEFKHADAERYLRLEKLDIRSRDPKEPISRRAMISLPILKDRMS